jgi:hypothetical protein
LDLADHSLAFLREWIEEGSTDSLSGFRDQVKLANELFNTWFDNTRPRQPPDPEPEFLILNEGLRCVLCSLDYEYAALSLGHARDEQLRFVAVAAINQSWTMAQMAAETCEEVVGGTVLDARTAIAAALNLKEARKPLEVFVQKYSDVAAKALYGDI